MKVNKYSSTAMDYVKTVAAGSVMGVALLTGLGSAVLAFMGFAFFIMSPAIGSLAIGGVGLATFLTGTVGGYFATKGIYSLCERISNTCSDYARRDVEQYHASTRLFVSMPTAILSAALIYQSGIPTTLMDKFNAFQCAYGRDKSICDRLPKPQVTFNAPILR